MQVLNARADPTRRDVVRIINDMIKSRDFWMPFAPVVLADPFPNLTFAPLTDLQVDPDGRFFVLEKGGRVLACLELVAAAHFHAARSVRRAC